MHIKRHDPTLSESEQVPRGSTLPLPALSARQPSPGPQPGLTEAMPIMTSPQHDAVPATISFPYGTGRLGDLEPPKRLPRASTPHLDASLSRDITILRRGITGGELAHSYVETELAPSPRLSLRYRLGAAACGFAIGASVIAIASLLF